MTSVRCLTQIGSRPICRVKSLLKSSARFALSNLISFGVATRRRFFAERKRRPLYESSVLDDLLFGQPLNILVRIFRSVVWRNRTARGSISVAIVNWNTLDILQTVLQAVDRYSPSLKEVLVVDNGSTDGSRKWLADRPFGVRPVLLPINIGHGRALDVGAALSRSEFLVTLDSDAFPFRKDWLETLMKPLIDEGLLAAGMWGPRDRLHPACAVYRRDWLRKSNISFSNFNPHRENNTPPVFGENTWDTGELISNAIGPDSMRLFPQVGTDFGGVMMNDNVYHHLGVTVARTDAGDPRNDVHHVQGWHRATAALLKSHEINRGSLEH